MHSTFVHGGSAQLQWRIHPCSVSACGCCRGLPQSEILFTLFVDLASCSSSLSSSNLKNSCVSCWAMLGNRQRALGRRPQELCKRFATAFALLEETAFKIKVKDRRVLSHITELPISPTLTFSRSALFPITVCRQNLRLPTNKRENQ